MSTLQPINSFPNFLETRSQNRSRLDEYVHLCALASIGMFVCSAAAALLKMPRLARDSVLTASVGIVIAIAAKIALSIFASPETNIFFSLTNRYPLLPLDEQIALASHPEMNRELCLGWLLVAARKLDRETLPRLLCIDPFYFLQDPVLRNSLQERRDLHPLILTTLADTNPKYLRLLAPSMEDVHRHCPRLLPAAIHLGVWDSVSEELALEAHDDAFSALLKTFPDIMANILKTRLRHLCDHLPPISEASDFYNELATVLNPQELVLTAPCKNAVIEALFIEGNPSLAREYLSTYTRSFLEYSVMHAQNANFFTYLLFLIHKNPKKYFPRITTEDWSGFKTWLYNYVSTEAFLIKLDTLSDTFAELLPHLYLTLEKSRAPTERYVDAFVKKLYPPNGLFPLDTRYLRNLIQCCRRPRDLARALHYWEIPFSTIFEVLNTLTYSEVATGASAAFYQELTIYVDETTLWGMPIADSPLKQSLLELMVETPELSARALRRWQEHSDENASETEQEPMRLLLGNMEIPDIAIMAKDFIPQLFPFPENNTQFRFLIKTLDDLKLLGSFFEGLVDNAAIREPLVSFLKNPDNKDITTRFLQENVLSSDIYTRFLNLFSPEDTAVILRMVSWTEEERSQRPLHLLLERLHPQKTRFIETYSRSFTLLNPQRQQILIAEQPSSTTL